MSDIKGSDGVQPADWRRWRRALRPGTMEGLLYLNRLMAQAAREHHRMDDEWGDAIQKLRRILRLVIMDREASPILYEKS